MYLSREVKRTEGISTTDVVGRMLFMTRQHFYKGDKEYTVEKEHSSVMGQDKSARSPWTGCSQFLPTTKKIIQFSEGTEPKVILNKYLNFFFFLYNLLSYISAY